MSNMRNCVDCGAEVGKRQVRCQVCRCNRDAERNAARRARLKSEGAQVHGYGGYSNGCRCQTCRDAKREYVRAARAAGKMPDKRKHHDPRVPGYTSRPSLRIG